MAEFRRCSMKYMISIKKTCFSNLEDKNWFLFLKLLTLEHTLSKRIICEYKHHIKGSEGHLHQEMGNELLFQNGSHPVYPHFLP